MARKHRRMAVATAAVVSVATAATAFGATGALTTIAGQSGTATFGGDNGPAAAATFSSPQFLTRAPDGAVIVDDWVDQVVRRIDPQTGTVTTIAGTPGVASSSATAADGDGGPATSATLNMPSGIAFLKDGTMLIADAGDNRIRAVNPTTHVITTVAGTGATGTGTNGDGGAATSAQLNQPYDVAVLPSGADFLIADSGHNRIRKVASGIISAYAGTGTAGEHDDANALNATFSFPQSLSSADGAHWLVADRTGDTIRQVGPQGVTTVAGQAGVPGTATSPGDGGPATSATLDLPLVVLALPDNGFLVADAQHYRIRRVSRTGQISTVVGTGVAGYDGDGDVTTGRIGEPVGLLENADGSLTFVDWWNSSGTQRMRIRRADIGLPTAGVSDVAPGSRGQGAPQATAAPGGATTPAATPTLPAATPPRAGKSVDVAASGKGKVTVRLPGTTTDIPLEQASSLPVGAVVDASSGAVTLTSARDRKGTTQTGTFSGGRFRVEQTASARPMTKLVLVGGSYAGCPKTAAAARVRGGAIAARVKRSATSVVRKLWGHDHHGHFVTQGTDAAASVRGTHWLTEDRCDGTLTRVVSGVVAVRDLHRHRTVLVRAGHAYLARAPRR